MSHPIAARLAALAAALCCVTMGPVSSASASAKSIETVFKSYNGKIQVAEGRVLSASGEYEQSSDPKDPTAIQAAISESVAVLSSLKGKVARQSAHAPNVRKARSKIVKGLSEVIVGYGDLSVAFGEKATNAQAAKIEAEKADALGGEGRKNLREGLRLLG